MASSKKKISQLELRRLMNEQKKKLQTNVKKIESPLAKYDKDGTLFCIVCETVVRSENVWSIHLNSKNHKQNILSKVKKKELSNENFKEPAAPILKRVAPTEPKPQIPPKKIKSILKNASANIKSKPSGDQELDFPVTSIEKPIIVDFKSDSVHNVKSSESDMDVDCDTGGQETLPEGFFDDPKLDAKVRNVEYRDPIEEEWEQFQKEIKEETSKAQQIIAEDQEEATTERQIDEIDEQIRNWSRVLNLEKKKEKVSATVTETKKEEDEEDLSDNEDFEEFLDWRSKKSFDYKLNNRILSS